MDKLTKCQIRKEAHEFAERLSDKLCEALAAEPAPVTYTRNCAGCGVAIHHCIEPLKDVYCVNCRLKARNESLERFSRMAQVVLDYVQGGATNALIGDSCFKAIVDDHKRIKGELEAANLHVKIVDCTRKADTKRLSDLRGEAASLRMSKDQWKAQARKHGERVRELEASVTDRDKTIEGLRRTQNMLMRRGQGVSDYQRR